MGAGGIGDFAVRRVRGRGRIWTPGVMKLRADSVRGRLECERLKRPDYCVRRALETLSGSNDNASAFAAQPVAMVEIH